MQKDYSNSPLITSADKKFYLIQREDTLRKHEGSHLKKLSKHHHSSNDYYAPVSSSALYSHVKSKVYNKLEINTPVSRDPNRNTPQKETQMHSLVKKLSSSYFVQLKLSEGEFVQLETIKNEPTFSNVPGLRFTAEDVFNLYLGSKNLEAYQCLLYRNTIFSNVNPKRAVNYHKKFISSELDWNFKKEYDLSDSVETKLGSIIFHQLSNIKRK